MRKYLFLLVPTEKVTRKIFSTIVGILVFIIIIQAQPVLYALTGRGGVANAGAIISYQASNSTFSVVKSFESIEQSPQGSLTKASNGKLYGLIGSGGIYGSGVIFSFDPANNTYTKLKDFDGINGAHPFGSLIQANDGKLYGLTGGGGANNRGVIFSFDPSANSYAKLKDFDGINGANPSGSLMQANDGKLYGMTGSGGANNRGVIFSFDPSTNVYAKLLDFDGINGEHPSHNSLIQANDGKLYGITTYGGNYGFDGNEFFPSGNGVIFSFDPVNNIYTKLKDFDGINGANPSGSLIQANDSKLYGMTYVGGIHEDGVIFSFDPSSNTFDKLMDFDGINGAGPNGRLTQWDDGKLYGMTSLGSNCFGVIFSFDPSANTYAKLMVFDNINGAGPVGSLTEANDGRFYGMTAGFNSTNGVIFSFHPGSNAYSKLWEFATNYAGSYPSGNLTKAFNGKLYGLASSGGSNGYGVIFSFDPSGNIYEKLMDFEKTNGAKPVGSLTPGTDGKLYGMTSFDGGVIFSFDPSSNSYTKLRDFNGLDGSPGDLLQARDGKLYGMTSWGGAYQSGVIFSFDPSTNTYSKLMDFDGSNGSRPTGNLLQASDGKLYGMTGGSFYNGQIYYGAIFSFDPLTNTYSKLMDFDGTTNGAFPLGGLMQASDGKLYGMVNGGSYQGGVIFSFDPVTNAYSKLMDFDGSNGSGPTGRLLQASDGKFYGMTRGGGSYSRGVIFSFDPSNNTYVKLKDFDGLNVWFGDGNQPVFIDLNCTVFVNTVTAPIDPVPVNTSINLNVVYSGANAATTLIKWGDGTPDQTITNPPASFATSHAYTTPGVYAANVTLTDACAKSTAAYIYQYIVIYDPSAGFVTGSGWINSPAGAYRPDVSLSGKGIFGFESKYQHGTTVPTGNTEFKFQVAGMSFKSTNYEWLVISGSRAQYKGIGTINNAGNYGFLLTAIDGDLRTPKTPDLFRIKIWDKDNGGAIVYDNQFGSPDEASLTTQLGNGSILIHATNNGGNTTIAATDENKSVEIINSIEFKITAQPNPSRSNFILRMQSSSSESMQIKVLDVWGRIVETRNNIAANANISVGRNYSPGIYFVEVMQGSERRMVKVIRQ